MLTKQQQFVVDWWEQKMTKERIFENIKAEEKRQSETFNLVASENYPSSDVMRAVGNQTLISKYTEGKPFDRYYGGCRNFDLLESTCQQEWKKAFNTDYHVNVQPHSGSNANLAAYMASVRPGQKIISFNPNGIGHLTHGAHVNISGKLYNFLHFGLNDKGKIDYDALDHLLRTENDIGAIMIGYSSLSEQINYKKIADMLFEIFENKPFPIFIADISHTAGFIAVGLNNSPFGYADIITTTTHKTLRGPRGALIFCRPELADEVDAAVFPGIQGGALQNIIAGKAIAAIECQDREFARYLLQVNSNAVAMQDVFAYHGFEFVGKDHTSNHMFIIDLSKTNSLVTGEIAQQILEQEFNIIVNKQVVPNDKRSPKVTSGIRIGTAAETTKGTSQDKFMEIAEQISKTLSLLQYVGYEVLDDYNKRE